jgi:hypothetical protein
MTETVQMLIDRYRKFGVKEVSYIFYDGARHVPHTFRLHKPAMRGQNAAANTSHGRAEWGPSPTPTPTSA